MKRHDDGGNKSDAAIDGYKQCRVLRRWSGLRLIRGKINIADVAMMGMLARPIGSRMRDPQRLCGEENGKRKNNRQVSLFHTGAMAVSYQNVMVCNFFVKRRRIAAGNLSLYPSIKRG